MEQKLDRLIDALQKRQGASAEDDSSSLDVQQTEKPARITVQLPAQARLYVNDVHCPLTSGTRSFETPKLEPNKRYYYTLRVETQQNGQRLEQSRRVILAAGEHVQVNFNQPATVNTVQR